MKIIFSGFLLFFTIGLIQHSIASMNKKYCTISVNNKKVPSLIPWPQIENFRPQFKGKTRLVRNKKLYYKYILPFEEYLGLRQKPIIILETPKHNIPSEGLAYPRIHNKITPHSIIVVAPAWKNVPTILHELTHIYCAYQTMKIQRDCFSRWKIFIPSIVAMAAIGFSEYPLSMLTFTLAHLSYLIFAQDNFYNQLEEIICDSCVAVALQRKKAIDIIKQDIAIFKRYLKKDKKPHQSLRNILIHNFFSQGHPLNKIRIEHLEKVQELLKKGDSEHIKKWITDQEKLLKRKGFRLFPLFFSVPHL